MSTREHPICFRCGSSHPKRDLSDPCKLTVRCANCKGSHHTHDKECPEYKKAVHILATKIQTEKQKEVDHQGGPVTTFVNSTNAKAKGFPVAMGVPWTSSAKSLGGSEPVLKTVNSNHPLTALDLVRVLTGLSLDGALLDIHQNKHSVKELHQATHMGCLTLKDNLGVTTEEGSIQGRNIRWCKNKGRINIDNPVMEI